MPYLDSEKKKKEEILRGTKKKKRKKEEILRETSRSSIGPVILEIVIVYTQQKQNDHKPALDGSF